MPKFIPKRQEQIMGQMLARTLARSELSDVADTSAFKHLLAAAARSDAEQYYQMSLILQLFSIDTAAGDDLDGRAAEIQPGTLQRIAARKAQGAVVFSRPGVTGTTVIPVGTKVKTASGLAFTASEPGTITATSPEQVVGHGVGRDSGLVTVVADQPGAAGNVAGGTVTAFVSKPQAVNEVTNLSAFGWGLDKESDSSFRDRLRRYIAGLARCPISGIEQGVLGAQDPVSGALITSAHLWEDPVARGSCVLYIDDGSGAAESVAERCTALVAVYTWAGTTTVTTPHTGEVVVGDWIRLDADGQWFEVTSIVPNVSVTLLNPGSDTIPTGAGPSSRGAEVVTAGLSGSDEALGGERRLTLGYRPVKDVLPVQVSSDVRGVLVRDTDYTLNPATGLLVFGPPLVTGEKIVASYIYYTGLIAFAQKIVDGDPADRATYPGYRAAGVLVRVQTPQVQLQQVVGVVTVAEGYDQQSTLDAVRQAILDYINRLEIGADVIRAQLISAIIQVPGVVNVLLSTPADDVLLLDEQLARTQSALIDLQ